MTTLEPEPTTPPADEAPAVEAAPEPAAPAPTPPAPIEKPKPQHTANSGLAVLGALLVVFGVVFLAQQLAGEALGDQWWPFLVMAPGLALLAVGLIVPNAGMIIGGSVVTTIALVLLYQNTTGLWATWAYAWALVGPFASGVGSMIGGWRTDNQTMVRAGARTAGVGLILFVIGYLFFEQVIGLSGQPTVAEWVLPVVLVVVGALLLANAVREWTRREPAAGAQ